MLCSEIVRCGETMATSTNNDDIVCCFRLGRAPLFRPTGVADYRIAQKRNEGEAHAFPSGASPKRSRVFSVTCDSVELRIKTESRDMDQDHPKEVWGRKSALCKRHDG